MAYHIQAWKKHGPRVVNPKTMESKEFINRLTRGVNQTKGTTLSFLAELDDILVESLQIGRGVKLPNGWTISVSGKKDGTVEINVSVGKEMQDRVNADFNGEWINAQNIGKTNEEICGIWNEDNPNDQITLNGQSDTTSTTTEPTTEPDSDPLPQAV
jgi:hypothetical protein